ncbi:MAG: hypothetical protein WD874_01145 [Parcubacteria group bacterium]
MRIPDAPSGRLMPEPFRPDIILMATLEFVHKSTEHDTFLMDREDFHRRLYQIKKRGNTEPYPILTPITYDAVCPKPFSQPLDRALNRLTRDRMVIWGECQEGIAFRIGESLHLYFVGIMEDDYFFKRDEVFQLELIADEFIKPFRPFYES